MMQMTDGRPRDPNQLAKSIIDIAAGAGPKNGPLTGQIPR
jgi:hypothetical protein